MEVNGQLHARSALLPEERAPGTPWIGGSVGPRSRCGRGEEDEKNPSTCREFNAASTIRISQDRWYSTRIQTGYLQDRNRRHMLGQANIKVDALYKPTFHFVNSHLPNSLRLYTWQILLATVGKPDFIIKMPKDMSYYSQTIHTQVMFC
jgi:hypothetical protein